MMMGPNAAIVAGRQAKFLAIRNGYVDIFNTHSEDNENNNDDDGKKKNQRISSIV